MRERAAMPSKLAPTDCQHAVCRKKGTLQRVGTMKASPVESIHRCMKCGGLHLDGLTMAGLDVVIPRMQESHHGFTVTINATGIRNGLGQFAGTYK